MPTPESDIYNKNEVDITWPEESPLPAEPTTATVSWFTIVLIILIGLLLLILGGLLLWGRSLFTAIEPAPTPSIERPRAEQNNEPESTNAEADVAAIQAVSTSNELGPLESDIESTMTATLDADLITIDAIMNEVAP